MRVRSSHAERWAGWALSGSWEMHCNCFTQNVSDKSCDRFASERNREKLISNFLRRHGRHC